MCGIVGIFSHKDVNTEIFDSLIHLQHRGQDAAGVITLGEEFRIRKGLGLVQEIFSLENMSDLIGHIGIGHTRYPTAGSYHLSDVQPLISQYKDLSITLAHNGNLVNHQELAIELIQLGLYSENLLASQKESSEPGFSSDSAVLLNLFSYYLAAALPTDNFFNALTDAFQNILLKVKGSYSVVSLIKGKGLVAFRDPHGIRPLVIGERLNPLGSKDYIISSETTMFYALGFSHIGDIAPGELVFINSLGRLQRKILNQKKFSPCIFEYVYFARPDSVLNQVGVYRSRLHMGQNLAKHWKKTHPTLLPDVVIPVPFTSNTAALSFAHELGVRYTEGLYKNPFIGRTFIMPDGKKRRRSVQHKLTPQKSEIQDMKVLLLDDSLVRGNTSVEIVKMVKAYGAKEIYFVLACPPIKHPCFYGIDIPSRQELIAAYSTVEEIRQHLGVDQLLYLEADDLVEAVSRHHPDQMQTPCMACMNGAYVTGEISEEKMTDLGTKRFKEKGAL